MKTVCILLCFLLCLPLFAGCGAADSYESQSFFAMDTFCEVHVYSEAEDSAAIFASCKQLVDEIERNVSVTREGGDLFAFNQAERGIDGAATGFLELIGISEEISRVTEGAFDIRTGALIALWQRCETEGRLPSEQELAEALSLVSAEVTLEGDSIQKSSPSLRLNFGAIGKGYAADLLKAHLTDLGVSCGMISFVSSVTVFGERQKGDFRVAVRRPDLSGELAGYVTLADQSLSVSGNYERYYEIGGTRYDHILDPQTGYPAAQNVESAVVIADSGAVADALSTAVTVMGAQKTLDLYNSGALAFEAALFCGDEILVTDGFAHGFVLSDPTYTVVLLSERY